jgi:hypothetical protein
MDIKLIILGVVIVVLVYVLYLYASTSTKTLVAQASLNTPSSIPAISGTNIVNPTDTRYSYEVWIYVNSWNNTSMKGIFSRTGNISLYLEKDTPTLKCAVACASTSTTTNTTAPQLVTITTNFPIQRWTQIIVSVDNNIFDAYINGKLVVSNQFTSFPLTPGNSNVSISLGHCFTFTTSTSGTTFNYNTIMAAPSDTVVSKFIRNTEPMDPQTAWNSYMGGNGITSMTSQYNANLSILKNNAQFSNIALL